MTDDGAAPPDDQLRTRRCEVCGQEYDLGDPDQIYHHSPEPHEPLAPKPG